MSLSITSQAIESREFWQNQYTPIPLDSVCVRHWKLDDDSRSSREILKSLDHRLKPLLPQGHIWLATEDRLEILRHKDEDSSNFKIHLFGPDQKNRIHSLVIDLQSKEHTPLFGMTMTKREVFFKDLRNKYPQDTSFFKQNDKSYWRGHIIDYNDTLGFLEDESSLSTSFSANYKPEPEGAWANTIRKEIVGDIREIEGSYSELMLYGFHPETTDKGKKIPEAVFLSTLTVSQQYLTSYYVPKDHSCHEWKGKVKAKAQKELSNPLFFPPLFANFPFPLQEDPLGKEHHNIDLLEGYKLLRNAEMEYSRSTYKIEYLIYAKEQLAPLEILDIWLKRSLIMAYHVTIAFQGNKPPFPQSLMNRLNALWNREEPLFHYVEQLGKIALAILQKIKPREIVIHNKIKKEKIEELSSKITEIYCVSSKNLQYNQMIRQIDDAIAIGSSMKIHKITTEVATLLFPEIDKKAKEKSSEYRPLLQVTASCKRWEKKVEALTIQYFGKDIFQKEG